MVKSYLDEEQGQIRPGLYVREIDPLSPWLAEPDLLKNVKQEHKDEMALAIFSLSCASLISYMLWENQEIIVLEQSYGHNMSIEMLITLEYIFAIFLVFVIYKTYLLQKSHSNFDILRGIILFWIIRIIWIFSLFYSRTSRAVAEIFSIISFLIIIWIFLQIYDYKEQIFLFIYILFWHIYWIYYTFLISSHPWLLIKEEEISNIF